MNAKMCTHRDELMDYCADCDTSYCGICQDRIHAHCCVIRVMRREVEAARAAYEQVPSYVERLQQREGWC